MVLNLRIDEYRNTMLGKIEIPKQKKKTQLAAEL